MVEISNSNYQVKLPTIEPSIGKLKEPSVHTSENPLTVRAENSFSKAFYGDSEYSLIRPNNRTDEIAQNIDFIA